MDEIVYGDRLSSGEYRALREAVGWKALSERQIDGTLYKGLFLITARYGGRCAGMTRLVGDGAYFFLLADVIVHPDYQGRGIGKRMVTSALEFVRACLRDGESASVNMMAAKSKEPFYEKLGFTKRPDDTFGAGMSMLLKK
jgi:GNAT superfamily N-acetyltransferase